MLPLKGITMIETMEWIRQRENTKYLAFIQNNLNYLSFLYPEK